MAAGDCAGAQGFGEQQAVAGLRAAVLEDSFRIDQARNRVAEFGFFVADAVAADYDASGLDHFGEAAGENVLEDFEIAFFGEANHGEGGDGASAHGVNVAERVGGGDLAEGVGVVHDGGEEIDGLDECQIGVELIDAGVVGVVEADQDVGIMLAG